jgi:hypothetical protein
LNAELEEELYQLEEAQKQLGLAKEAKENAETAVDGARNDFEKAKEKVDTRVAGMMDAEYEEIVSLIDKINELGDSEGVNEKKAELTQKIIKYYILGKEKTDNVEFLKGAFENLKDQDNNDVVVTDGKYVSGFTTGEDGVKTADASDLPTGTYVLVDGEKKYYGYTITKDRETGEDVITIYESEVSVQKAQEELVAHQDAHYDQGELPEDPRMYTYKKENARTDGIRYVRNLMIMKVTCAIAL